MKLLNIRLAFKIHMHEETSKRYLECRVVEAVVLAAREKIRVAVGPLNSCVDGFR